MLARSDKLPWWTAISFGFKVDIGRWSFFFRIGLWDYVSFYGVGIGWGPKSKVFALKRFYPEFSSLEEELVISVRPKK